jgi:hypothetical protein
MSSSANFEKFLRGEPLTEELAQLREGKLPLLEQHAMFPATGPAEPAIGAGELNEPLAKNERNSLREMRLSAGWPVFQKLMLRAIMGHTERAVNLSQVDPLRNSQTIAETWAYVNTFKRVHRDINLLVETETAQEAKKDE